MEISEDKNVIRRAVITKRDAIGETKRGVLSDIIAEKLFATELYKQAKAVLSYASFGSEVETDRINTRVINDSKELYLPKTYTDRKVMDFYRVTDMDSLIPGTWDIREPEENESTRLDISKFAPNEVISIVPCVAYDSEGNRLGYGGGYYDRFLIDHKDIVGATIVVAFKEQITDSVPVAPHDVKPAWIITE